MAGVVLDDAARIRLSGLIAAVNLQPSDRRRLLIVTPSYQQAGFLGETIASINRQRDPRTVYVVADGGSTDGSREILHEAGSTIDHVLWGPDGGQSDAIVSAIDAAKLSGQPVWFNWINSDDILIDGCIERLFDTIDRNPDADAIAFDVEAFGDGLASYVMPNRGLSARAMLRDDDYRFAQPGLWCRLDKLAQCGGIDRTLQYGFDWDLWVRYLAKFPNVIYTQSLGAKFRLHDQSKTLIETSKDDSRNQFEIEVGRIRDKLAGTLPPQLGRWCEVGGRRRRWHCELARIMDDVSQSPLDSVAKIASAWRRDPAAVGSRRTCGAIARLLSRYVRRRSSWDGDSQR